jgi:copper(I)-binding protein
MQKLCILAAAALAFAGSAHAASYKLGALEVADPWSRPAMAGGNGAGFMVVTNRGKTADALKSVEAPFARKAEVHRSSTAGGVMRMERQDAGVAIPAGKAVTFAPGGYHVMFLGLGKATKAGDRLPATLVFQSGAKMKVEFVVGAAAPAPAADHAHHH